MDTDHKNFYSVQFSCSVMSDSLWPHELQHARPPSPSPTPGVHSDSRVSDAIQPSHPLSSPSPPAPNPSQHQSLFRWVSSSNEVDCLTVLDSNSCESTVVRKDLLQAFPFGLWMFISFLYLHIFFPLCVSVQISPIFKATSHIGSEPTLMISF